MARTMMTANQYRTPASPNARRSSHGAGASTSGGGSRQALLLRLDKLITESEEMVKGADEIIRDLFDAALFAKEMEDAALVQTLKESLRKILIKQNEMRTRGQGVKEAKEQGMATEDIVKYVERAQAENEGSKWTNIEQHSKKWHDFEREIEGKETAGAATGAGQEEDEDLIFVPTQAQQQGFINTRCPLTGMDIGELTEPVRDSKGYIYEMEAIKKYLQVRRGYGRSSGSSQYQSKKCPVAGAQHNITFGDLESAQMQISAYKRRERHTQNQTQNTNIHDL